MSMKKWFVAALASLFVMPAMAQLGEVRNNWAVGVNVGMNMNKADFSPQIKQNSHNGMSFGMVARYISEKYFGDLNTRYIFLINNNMAVTV